MEGEAFMAMFGLEPSQVAQNGEASSFPDFQRLQPHTFLFWACTGNPKLETYSQERKSSTIVKLWAILRQWIVGYLAC